MRTIGDKQWRSAAASILWDSRRVIDRAFARKLLIEFKKTLSTRFGEPLDQNRPS